MVPAGITPGAAERFGCFEKKLTKILSVQNKSVTLQGFSDGEA